MRYAEFKKQRQDSFNNLPMKAAFSNEQFARMMSEWGLDTDNKEDLKKIRHLVGGAYCLATDVHLFHEWSEENAKLEEEFLSDEEQLKDALIYEFGNYECGYTMDPEDAVNALFTEEEQKNNELLKKVFPIAWKEYLDKCE